MVSIRNLQQKEVINICDASRVGYVCDVIVGCNGCVEQLVVPCSNGIFSAFIKNKVYCIPWCDVVKVGEDIILVNVKSDNLLIEELE